MNGRHPCEPGFEMTGEFIRRHCEICGEPDTDPVHATTVGCPGCGVGPSPHGPECPAARYPARIVLGEGRPWVNRGDAALLDDEGLMLRLAATPFDVPEVSVPRYRLVLERVESEEVRS